MNEDQVRHHIAYKRDGEKTLPAEVAQRMLDALDAGAEPDYQALLTAARWPAPGPVVFHTAPASDRDVIGSGGLEARDPNKNPQPNMVSLKKLLKALVNHQIDSYYLLIIKVRADGNGDFTADVYLVDLLDYIDFATFDSGPGQIMLKEAAFYSAVAMGYEPPKRTLLEKIEILASMLDDADRRLIENRTIARERLAVMLAEYRESIDKPINQEAFHLK